MTRYYTENELEVGEECNEGEHMGDTIAIQVKDNDILD